MTKTKVNTAILKTVVTTHVNDTDATTQTAFCKTKRVVALDNRKLLISVYKLTRKAIICPLFDSTDVKF